MDGELTTLAISAAGLSAQRTRMNVLAENLANAETTRSEDGGPYQRKLVVLGSEPAASFGETLETERGNLVKVQEIAPSPDPPRLEYMPAHPHANAEGYIALPNIKPVLEMVDLLGATRAYEAILTAVQALKSMTNKALEIGR